MLKIFIVGLLGALGTAAPALAASDSELLCAVTHTAECASDNECRHGKAVDVYIPTFLRIHLDKKQIISIDEKRKEEITLIKFQETVGDRLILAGVDGNRSWSAVLSINTGEMTVMISDFDLAFVLFGKCLVP